MTLRFLFVFWAFLGPIAAGEGIRNEYLELLPALDAKSLLIRALPADKGFSARVFFPGRIESITTGNAADSLWGEAQEIKAKHGENLETTFRLFRRRPFVHIHTRVLNPQAGPRVMKSLATVDMKVSLGGQKLLSYGTGGLSDLSSAKGSYCFHAYVNPETRNGFVTAFLTHDRGAGAFFPRPAAEGVETEAWVKTQIDFGNFRVEPRADRDTDVFLAGFFDDARLGLEAYADLVARKYAIRLKKKPCVYCTWYHARSSNEKLLRENAAFAARHLKPFGLSVFQIDDGWQAVLPKDFPHPKPVKRTGPVKVFTDSNRNYPHGMAYTAKMIADFGFTPGIWFMPFAGNFRNPYFDPEIFARNPDGTLFHDSRWSGTCLDLSNPKARAFLEKRVLRIYGWGYRYFKLDGLHTGMPSYNVYVNKSYLNRDFGKAVLHDPKVTYIEAYRTGLGIIRRLAPDAFVLGCNVSQNMHCMGPSFGLLDAMRIGPDNGRAGRGKWKGVTAGAWHGTNLYFLNGRVWHNDPDPVYVRESCPLPYARWMCSWVAVSGAMHTSSYQYSKLPAERLDLLKRSLPTHSLPARPVDLFETSKPRIWLVQNDRLSVVGLFNWEEKEKTEIEYDIEKLGLEKDTTYVAFEYWSNRFIGEIRKTLKRTLEPGSCEVLALRKRSHAPQVLSTSRHITQGLMDVIEEKWDPAARTLKGRSRLVAGDPYELRIVVPGEGRWNVENAFAGSTPLQVRKEGPRLIRLVHTPRESGVSPWTVRFRT